MLSFLNHYHYSNNACVANCVKLIQKGSHSAVSNSMSFVADYFKRSRDNIVNYNITDHNDYMTRKCCIGECNTRYP